MTTAYPVTVIIPVHNGADYLAETLESVLAQTHPPVEILVIDDGSTDNSAAVAAAFMPRVRVISRTNAGVSASRNFGAAQANTEWIHFLDADDVWSPLHLALHKEALAHEHADVCYSGRRNLVRDDTTGTFRTTRAVPIPSAEDYAKVVMERCPGNPSTMSIRRTTFLQTGGFDSRYDSIEDWDMWVRLVQHGAQFVCSPEPSVLYRVHAASATNNPIPVMHRSIATVRQSILPKQSPLRRLCHGSRVISRLESEAAILLRQNRLAGALPLMLRSIVRHPFHASRRYKIAAHMLLFRTKVLRPTASPR